MSIDIPALLDRLCHRYPSLLVDAVAEHVPGDRIVALKNVTVGEEFFQGHFPGVPLMPGVLMLETFAQVATILLLSEDDTLPVTRMALRGVSDAKFRRQVVPGDQLRVVVDRVRRRSRLATVAAVAHVGDQVVAEAELLFGVARDRVAIDASAQVHPDAVIGDETVVGPNAFVGPHVRLGRGCQIGASAVVDGWTEVGDETIIFPFASIGLAPQDQKYRGEVTRLSIGTKNIFREFVTIHRGTEGGGGVTRIGDRNLFMAYAHVAHDTHLGNDIICGHMVTLGGHVTVEDFAYITAGSGVHQFCRVGQHAFIGGYSVVTKDALPFARTVGNRARIYDLNTIGLLRRGFSPDTVTKLKRAYRYLLQSKLNTSQALGRIEQDETVDCPEVRYLTEFIRSSERGALLRRPARQGDEVETDD